jgi:hypothetical protein
VYHRLTNRDLDVAPGTLHKGLNSVMGYLRSFTSCSKVPGIGSVPDVGDRQCGLIITGRHTVLRRWNAMNNADPSNASPAIDKLSGSGVSTAASADAVKVDGKLSMRLA